MSYRNHMREEPTMGYGHYLLPDGREAGYLVEAPCDHPASCPTIVFRGLDALCGASPDGHRSANEPGCGKYFCGAHQHDHDCTNPSCGKYSADGALCCGERDQHPLPHRDIDTDEVFDRTEDDDIDAGDRHDRGDHMSVYVDDALIPARVQNGPRYVTSKWSHLMADSTDELLAFAVRLGLRRTWIQFPGTPKEHFDLTEGKRWQAIRLGAVPITYGHEGAALMRAKREGRAFDLAAERDRRTADV